MLDIQAPTYVARLIFGIQTFTQSKIALALNYKQ